MKHIAIQGIEGSFHDIAAHQFFENEEIELICCKTFEQLFATLRDDPTAIGMAAIENTIAGSLLHNYELLRDSGTSIVGEHKLRIKHSFLCLPDDDWDDITEVHSHPVALMQCRDFLRRHDNLKVVGLLKDETNAEDAETNINEYGNTLREEHFTKVEQKGYNYQTGVFFMDIVAELEKIGDFIVNISQCQLQRD